MSRSASSFAQVPPPLFPPAGARLSPEDVLRARDRRRVLKERSARHWLRLFWLLIGPGILVMLGENDGPSMVSYATTGATYGVGFFVPFILLTFVMAFAVQEMTVRLGAATHRGHAELIFERFGPFWGWFAMGDLVFGNVLTLVTEFVAIQAGGLYFGVPPLASVAIGVALVAVSLAFRRYATWERSVMALAIFNLLFIPAALYAHPDGAALVRAIGTWRPLHGGVTIAFLTLVMANIGATVTPWMIFFQQSAVVDKGLTTQDLTAGRLDTALGAVLAAIAAIATVVAAAPLFANGVDAFQIRQRRGLRHRPRALYRRGRRDALCPRHDRGGRRRRDDDFDKLGLRAWRERAQEPQPQPRFLARRLFYGAAIASTVIAAAVVLIPGAPLLALTLTVNVIATLLMAPALLLLLILVNDREIMGGHANDWRGNLVGGTIVAGLVLIGAVYGIITVFPGLLGQ